MQNEPKTIHYTQSTRRRYCSARVQMIAPGCYRVIVNREGQVAKRRPDMFSTKKAAIRFANSITGNY